MTALLFRSVRRFALLGFAVTLLAAQGSAADGGERMRVTLVTGDGYPPYSAADLPHGGMAARLVARALQMAGATAEGPTFLPWKRAMDVTGRTSVDASFPWIETEERLERFRYSDPILFKSVFGWLRADDGRAVDTEADIDGMRVCAPIGFAPPSEIQTLAAKGRIRIERPSDVPACFAMLARGRVDMAIAEPDHARESIAARGGDAEGFRRTGLEFTGIALHLIVSRDHPQADAILGTFNRGLAALKATPEYSRIVEAYLP